MQRNYNEYTNTIDQKVDEPEQLGIQSVNHSKFNLEREEDVIYLGELVENASTTDRLCM